MLLDRPKYGNHMMDNVEILWKFYQEHCSWERHHEQQRSLSTNLLIAVAAGIIGVVTFDKQLNNTDLPLTIFLIMQGIFGAIFSAKIYECFCMHQNRANHYRKEIDALFPQAKILSIRDKADLENLNRFRELHPLRLHRFWIGLHLLITVFGIVLTILIVV
jgi:hypothetical protein